MSRKVFVTWAGARPALDVLEYRRLTKDVDTIVEAEDNLA
jgi:hypothetical protein